MDGKTCANWIQSCYWHQTKSIIIYPSLTLQVFMQTYYCMCYKHVATCAVEWGWTCPYATLDDIFRDFSPEPENGVSSYKRTGWELRLYRHMVITTVTREEVMAVTRNVSVTESPATNEQSLAPEIDENKHLNLKMNVQQKCLFIC